MQALSRWLQEQGRKLLAEQVYSVQHQQQQVRLALDEMKVLAGRQLALQQKARGVMPCLAEAEFKVFSQFGEDGILQYLIQQTEIQPAERSFVEFGVQDYLESCTRYLLVSDHWRGLVFDGDKNFIRSIQSQGFYWRHDLTARQAWITAENINQLISDHGFAGTLGVLVVDIDGNDYWVWRAVEVARPVIVAIEYNSLWGSQAAVTVPYAPDFDRTKAHYSWQYYGASVAALAQLGQSKGYALVGSNRAGNNLFFVRQDRIGSLAILSPAQAFVEAQFRESRNANGELDFLGYSARQQLLLDLPLLNIPDHQPTTLRQQKI